MPAQAPITPPAPRATRVRPPPGYYAALNEGEVAALAITADEHQQSDLENVHRDEVLTGWEETAMAAAVAEPTLAQALRGPDALEWQEALDYEISQLEKLGTWEVLDLPPGTNLIPCHFVSATK